MLGLLLVRITAILVAACYAGRLAIDMLRPGDERWQQRARMIWMIGGVSLLMHAAAAFQFQHHWSHAAAWEHTREQTLALTGWNSGHGLYANYAMTAWWLIDASCWMRTLELPQRHRGWYSTMMAAFGFLMVNATAVFGPGYWKYIVGALVVLVGIGGMQKSMRR